MRRVDRTSYSGAPGAARWLSIRDIAGDLGVSVSTAYKWSARGGPWFPRSIRLRNGDIRVRRDWYETWLGSLEEDSVGYVRDGRRTGAGRSR